MSYAMLYAVACKNVRYAGQNIRCRIRCRTSDLRYRMHVRHRVLRCHTCLTYDIDIRCRTCTTYDIVRVRCRTCTTYDIVCNIGIIRCRTSDIRHCASARIQMDSRRLPEHAAPGAARSVHGPGWVFWPAPPGGASRSMQHAGQWSGGRGCRSAGGAAARWAGLAGQPTGLLCGEERQSCRERKDQLLPLRQRAVIEAGTARGGRAATVRQTRGGNSPSCLLYAGAEGLEQSDG
jgi:hypothetical protein